LSGLSIAMALVILMAGVGTVHATAFTWTGAVDSNWAQSVSTYNWSGGSSSNGRYPGMVHTAYTDTATITSTTHNPVLLRSAVTLGGADPALTIGSASASLMIQSGGTLGVQGGISNLGLITVNTGGTLQNGSTSGEYVIGPYGAVGGTGGITLAGGTIGSLGGQFDFEQAITGYGTISAKVINFLDTTSGNLGVVTANSATALNITGVFANGTTSFHTPIVNVGTSVASPTGVLTVSGSGTFTNNAVLNIYGTFNNNTATAIGLAASGASATLAGGTLNGTGTGGFINTGVLSAYGNIDANLNNNTAASSTINAAGNINVSDIALNNAGNTSNGINLGSYTLDHFTAGNFALTSGGYTTLAGGAITNSGGGTMANSNQIRGYGTVSAPLTTNTGGITANTAGQTLTVSGNIASNTGSLSASAGTLLLESKITGTYTVSAKSSGGAEVDLNGADLVGPTGLFTYSTLGNNSSGYAGPIKLTGDSTLENNFQTNAAIGIQVNGNTLTVKNLHGSFTSGSYLDVGTGNLVINGPASVFSGGNIHLGGGNINYTTSNVVDTLQAGVTGYGDIKVELLCIAGLLAQASGGTLYIDGGALLSLPGGTYNNSTLSSSAGAVLDLRSTLTNSQPYTSYVNPNGGIVNLDGATLTSTTTGGAINLLAGTVYVTNDSALGGNFTASGTIAVNAGKKLNLSNGAFKATGVINTLTIAGTPTAPTAQVDIGKNYLVITAPGQLATVNSQIASGANFNSSPNNGWDGQGITSSNAAADSTGALAVGCGNADDEGLTGALFGTHVAAATDTLVMLTLAGDADLSGTVNVDDYNTLRSYYGATNATWEMGDFNYDGVVNADDYNILRAFYNQTVPAAPGLDGVAGAVPEPATMALLGLGALCALGRRKNRA
jgi:hypothetical protein